MRHEGRMGALQVLYALELTHQLESGAEDVLNLCSVHFESAFSGFELSPEGRGFVRKLVLGVVAHLVELDTLLRDTSHHWRPERMDRLDLCILRMAAYELAYDPATPPPVVINEAIELGKTFGSQDSAAFLNGILNQIAKVLSIQSGNTVHPV